MALMPTTGPFRINAQRAVAAVSPRAAPTAAAFGRAAPATAASGRIAPTAVIPKPEWAADATFEGPPPAGGTPERAAPVAAVRALPADHPRGATIPKGDEYFQRLVKLVPIEVLALYLTFQEIAASWLGVWAVVCLVLVLFVRTVGTHQAGKPIQIVSVLVAAVSFVLWVYATGGHFLQIKLPANIPGVTSVSVGVWTFLVPYFYKGD